MLEIEVVLALPRLSERELLAFELFDLLLDASDPFFELFDGFLGCGGSANEDRDSEAPVDQCADDDHAKWDGDRC